MVCFAISPSAHQLKSEGELAAHAHAIYAGYDGNEVAGTGDKYRYQTWANQNTGWKTGRLGTSTVGGNNPHNNLPPLYGVNRFRRIS